MKKHAQTKRGRNKSRGHDSAREQLLLAAQQLFAKKSFEAVSVCEIGNACRQNISLINYYFGGKKGIYLACIEAFGRKRLDFNERILTTPTSPEDFRMRLRFFIEEIFNTYAENPPLFSLMLRAGEDRDIIKETTYKDIFLKMLNTLKIFFEKAKKQKFIRSNVDTHICCAMLIGMLVHFMRTDHVEQLYFNYSLVNPEYRQKVIESLYNNFISGIV